MEVGYAALKEFKRRLDGGGVEAVKEIKEIAELALKFLVATKEEAADAKAEELGVSIYALSDSQLDEIIAGGEAGKN